MSEIFGGDKSRELWKLVNKISKKGTKKSRKKLVRHLGNTIYLFGCKCQELESIVTSLSDAVEKLKAKG